MIRTIRVEEITKNIKEMCIEANHFLAEDMEHAMKKAAEEEKSELGTKILNFITIPMTTGFFMLGTAAREFEDCRRGYDSDLSGYRNGSSVS